MQVTAGPGTGQFLSLFAVVTLIQRGGYVEVLAAQRIVYLEMACAELLHRSRAQAVPVLEGVRRRLAEKLDLPDVIEKHEIGYTVR